MVDGIYSNAMSSGKNTCSVYNRASTELVTIIQLNGHHVGSMIKPCRESIDNRRSRLNRIRYTVIMGRDARGDAASSKSKGQKTLDLHICTMGGE